MFLNKDQEKAKTKLGFYNYLLTIAIEYIAKGEFGKAAACHEHIAIVLDEIQELKLNKTKVNLVLKQFEGERQQRELLEKWLKV